jgi:NADH dehydrogenase
VLVILVAGATGHLGGLITRIFLDRRRDVRILVRPASPYSSLVQAGAQAAIGDLKEPSSLAAACEGVDTVITTANSALRGGGDTSETVDWQGNRNLIDAALRAGVKQFIFVSAVAAHVDSPVPLFQAKAKAEAYLRRSGVPYTILAPCMFTEVWFPMVVGRPALAGQPVSLVGEGRQKNDFISTADVAAFAFAAVGNSEADCKHLPLAGPQPLSWRDVIAGYERLLGRTLNVESLPPDSALPGLPDPVGRMVAQMMTNLEKNVALIDMSETSRVFGVKQKTLEDVLRQQLSS